MQENESGSVAVEKRRTIHMIAEFERTERTNGIKAFNPSSDGLF
ncbi:hypothetical protein [Lederbergia galactosidilytica]|nr:hypothetical protein [Lederbergia galactosidilytica]MBP1913226.1 hypothetical protein [Lederbergia galactosidilytica]